MQSTVEANSGVGGGCEAGGSAWTMLDRHVEDKVERGEKIILLRKNMKEEKKKVKDIINTFHRF